MSKKTKADADWLKALGKNIEKLILERGYDSAYDFWINAAGEKLSRAGLNYIISGKRDIRITTLRHIAKLLKVDLNDLLKF